MYATSTSYAGAEINTTTEPQLGLTKSEKKQQQEIHSIQAAGKRAIDNYCTEQRTTGYAILALPSDQIINESYTYNMKRSSVNLPSPYNNNNEIIPSSVLVKSPVIFPSMPDQTLVDALSPEQGSIPQQHNQRTYEAECRVYRALEQLEMLDDEVVVLHSFKYTKMHRKLFLAEDPGCKSKPKEIVGEHDFVVIIRNKGVVVFEVKDTPFDKQNFKTSKNASTKELAKAQQLITSIAEQCGITVDILKFSIFTSLKRDAARGSTFYQKLSKQEANNVLFSDDILQCTFNKWWKQNVADKITRSSHPHSNIISFESTIIGLWCTNKSKIDEAMFSPAYWISETDKKLKHSVITSRPKRPYTSKLKVSDVFKNCLGIQFLTQSQENIFKDDSVFITGPAGTGKSIMIQAKVIELVKERAAAEKIIVVVHGIKNAKKYDIIFKKVGISVLIVEHNNDVDTSTEMHAATCKVVLLCIPPYFLEDDEVQWVIKLLSAVREHKYHVLIDDMQCLFWGVIGHDYSNDTDYASKLSETLSAIMLGSAPPDKDYVVWFVCDIAQYLYYDAFTSSSNCDRLLELLSKLPIDRTRTLSDNLRNTLDVANLLSCIRTRVTPTVHTSDIVEFLPMQQPGHYIHGIMPCLYVLHKREESMFNNIVKTILYQLFAVELRLKYSDIAVIKCGESLYSDGIRSIIDDVLSKQEVPFTADSNASCTSNSSNNSIWVSNLEETVSLEWAVVIVVFSIERHIINEAEVSGSFSSLYLAVSRARVHCIIILVYHNDKAHGTAKEFVEILRPYIHVKSAGY